MNYKLENYKSDNELLTDALNFARSELQTELKTKLDKHYKNHSKIDFITKLISILANINK